MKRFWSGAEGEPARATVAAIIFSKDRPLQLDGALKSFRSRCTDVDQIRATVIYLATTSFMRNLYCVLAEDHPDVTFVRETRFKTNVVEAATGVDHLMFLVDDDIFIRDFAVAQVVAALTASQDAIGFSLRLGRNTSYCYMLNQDQSLPTFEATLVSDVLGFDWTMSESDFGYPLELASSVYRVADLLPLIERLSYRNPNTFETSLAARARQFALSHPRLLCYETSIVFCTPVNLVQTVSNNRVGARLDQSVNTLARGFYAGKRLDVDAYFGFVPESVQQEVELTFESVTGPRPRVSIIVPCYRQAEFLNQAIDSVIAQTFEDWELIIVNDGSDDETSSLAKGYIARHADKQIRLIETENQGLARARNTGIQASRGWMILPLDADDMLHPSMLEKSVAKLEGNPGYAIAYTDWYQFGEADLIVRSKEYNFERVCYRNQWGYCALYRRHAWRDVGGYNPNMEWGYEDWDFWIACAESNATGKRIPEPLFFYRVRASSMYTNALKHDRELRRRLAANHPALFTRWRRLWRLAKIAWPVLRSRASELREWMKSRVRTFRRRTSGGGTSISDADAYLTVCAAASREDAAFEVFRRDPAYTVVLEHVTEEQGRGYIQVLERDNPQLLGEWLDKFRSSDSRGSPRLYVYPETGPISPTTLRYVKVLSDLMVIFGDMTGMRIVEIGGGYGGQAKIIADRFSVASYTLIDLEKPLELAARFLGPFEIPGLEFRRIDELDPEGKYDLVISNYAFSELARGVQNSYQTLVVERAARGYMTVNFIGEEFGIESYSRTELLGLAPNVALRAEEPLTHPHNLILTWSK